MKNKKFIPADFDPTRLSPLNLAFVGDTVFDLFIKSDLVIEANRPVKKLRTEAAKLVNAASQAEFGRRIFETLSERERIIFRCGKNAKVNHYPKNMTREDYHLATAVEALFGYLYLCGNIERLEELIALF